MKQLVLMALLGLAVALFIAHCDDEGGSSGPVHCVNNDDCGTTEFCIEGICKDPRCTTTADCSQGQVCLPSGVCESESGIECGVSGKTCPPGKTCQGFQCVGFVCSPEGATQACWDACHMGNKICTKGNWTQCDAPPLEAEKCGDGVDNNCDGQTDEGCVQCTAQDPSTPCQTHCGAGEIACVNGVWSPCSAASDCYCDVPGASKEVACDKCGTQTSTCQEATEQIPGYPPPVYVWGDYSLCTGEGLCDAGQTEENECGNCGASVRTCQDDCTWNEWGECEDEGMCLPGSTDKKECGNCGEQVKVCGDDCYWEPWGECEAGAASCQLGQQESQPCGNCGTEIRTCEGTCAWSGWGSCQGQGECTPGEKDTGSCGPCGQKSRTCTNMCTWSTWSSCDGAGDCAPGETEQKACGPNSDKGICEKGTQQRTCGATCQWNSWGSCLGAVYPKSEICGDGIDQDCDGKDGLQPDQYEPNNSCSSCYWIDNNGADDPPDQTLFPTFDTKGAEFAGSDTNDYFCFYSTDNWNVPGFGENIKVDLTAQPVGTDGDLFLYKSLSDCQNDNAIASSVTVGGGDEHINWGETGDPDTGTYYVRVQNWSNTANCGKSYTLKIQGLK